MKGLDKKPCHPDKLATDDIFIKWCLLSSYIDIQGAQNYIEIQGAQNYIGTNA